jgi:dTDP-L-rhamnose 4-epimerase
VRVLVTGGADFIGSHVVRRLLDGGADVRVLDSLDPAVHAVAPDIDRRDVRIGSVADPAVVALLAAGLRRPGTDPRWAAL